MSHHRCEIILPPCKADAVEEAVLQVLEPFNSDPPRAKLPDTPDPETAEPKRWLAWAEEVEDMLSERAADRSHSFWDWHQLGGRWAGHHAIDRYEPERLLAFYAELAERKVTVSGLQFGKQELSPADQIPAVDALWAEMFPDSGLEHCPVFQHSNPRNHGDLPGDVCRVGELGQWTNAVRLIIAGPAWVDGAHTWDRVKAGEMWATEVWTGVSWMFDIWDGMVVPKLNDHRAKQQQRWDSGRPDWKAEWEARPTTWVDLSVLTDEWLAVTVDLHN